MQTLFVFHLMLLCNICACLSMHRRMTSASSIPGPSCRISTSGLGPAISGRVEGPILNNAQGTSPNNNTSANCNAHNIATPGGGGGGTTARQHSLSAVRMGSQALLLARRGSVAVTTSGDTEVAQADNDRCAHVQAEKCAGCVCLCCLICEA